MSPPRRYKSVGAPLDDLRAESLRLQRAVRQTLQTEIETQMAAAREAMREAIASTARASLSEAALLDEAASAVGNAVAGTETAIAAALGYHGTAEGAMSLAAALQHRAVEAAQAEAARATAAAVAGTAPAARPPVEEA